MASLPRTVVRTYRDPLDEVWLVAARRVGWEVARSEAVFASFDGRGTLTIATRPHFDPDDSLAQMVLHEMCHALVAGPTGMTRVDWGLQSDGSTLVQEHACHRLQAALAEKHGLRDFFAVTTDHRPYWNALPRDPLAPGPDPAIELARAARHRSELEPWASALGDALQATAAIADAVRHHAGPNSLWKATRPRHPCGFLEHASPELRCGTCAWSYRPDTSGTRMRCRRAGDAAGSAGAEVAFSQHACDRWEPRLQADECARCGACCREGFHLVPVDADESIAAAHPELLVHDRHGAHIPRPEGRCLALLGDGERAPFRCRLYSDRPRACRTFDVGGDACLEARRRVGLSR